MKPYVIIHNRLLIVFASLIMMIIEPNNGYAHNWPTVCHHSQLQSIALYNKDRGYVTVEKKRVLVNNISSEKYFLYQITLERGYRKLWFDPKVNRFICWNRNYTKLVAKASPRTLEHCIFIEQPQPDGFYVKYTSEYRKHGTRVEMKFNKNGAYPTRCNFRRHRDRHPVRKARCGESSFLLDNDRSQNCNVNNFCNYVHQKYNRKHDVNRIPPELGALCPHNSQGL